MNRGIILIALGHPYYGRMAHNLAASIKAIEPSMPIALMHDEEAVRHLQVFNLEKTFDHQILTTVFTPATYLKAKLFIHDFSPFEETIYLDADMVWLHKKPSELFDSLSFVDFTMINEGIVDLSQSEQPEGAYRPWATVEDIRREYNLSGIMYNYRSEMIYFRKSERNQLFFDTAKEIFTNPKVKPVDFAGSVPDELAFNIAGALLQHFPHQSGFRPVFWQHINKRNIPSITTILTDFYAYSMGGNHSLSVMKDTYNRIVANAFRKLNIANPWRYMDKRQFLPQRKTI